MNADGGLAKEEAHTVWRGRLRDLYPKDLHQRPAEVFAAMIHDVGNTSTVASEAIERFVTQQRLAHYRTAAGDLDSAVRLYHWNAAISGELFVMLGHTEIVLRNALDRQLRIWADDRSLGSWMDDTTTLRQAEQRDVAAAKTRRISRGQAIDHDAVVSEMSFGFWRYLLSAKYEATLWTPCLRFAFPNLSGSPRQVRNTLDRLHLLRNRIAHHEPVYRRNLKRDRDDCLRLLAWIDNDSKNWVKEVTRSAVAVLNERPVNPAA